MATGSASLQSAPARPARLGAWSGLVVAVLCLAGLYTGLYRDCLGRFFFLDDFWELKAASAIHIRSPLDLWQFFRPVPYFLLYRPLSTLLYFYLLRLFFGYDPTGYHAIQLAFHIINAVLVYAIADRLLSSRARALAVALVYALAPGHALAVYWNALFTMTGTAFFYFLGLWMWFRPDTRWRVPATFALFLLALLASEHAVSFPLVLTLVAVLLEPRWTWSRILRQQAAFYVVAAGYVAAKLYYIRYVLSGTNALAYSAYGLSFDPSVPTRHLGFYLGATFNPFYALVDSRRWTLVLGALLAGAAAMASLCVATGRWRAMPVRVAIFGVDLFIVTLAPVLFLRDHVEGYYVGIAGLGLALALVAIMQTVPRMPRFAPYALVAALLCVHLWSTGARLRQTLEFALFTGFSERAADWLQTLARFDHAAVDEIVVPKDIITQMAFDTGEAHRLFLCAPYRIRTSPALDDERPESGRLIIREPEITAPQTSGWFRSWDWVQSHCPP